MKLNKGINNAMSKYHAIVAAIFGSLVVCASASAAPRCAVELDTLFKVVIEAGPQTRSDGTVTSAFLSSNISVCTQTEPAEFDDGTTPTFFSVVTQDECGLLGKDVSAENRITARKYADALEKLDFLQLRISNLLARKKLKDLPQYSSYANVPIGYSSIAVAAQAALQCLKPI
jgi:hypothetical protein